LAFFIINYFVILLDLVDVVTFALFPSKNSAQKKKIELFSIIYYLHTHILIKSAKSNQFYTKLYEKHFLDLR